MKDFFKNIIKKIYIKENKNIKDGSRHSQASKFYGDLSDDISKLSLGCGNPVNFIPKGNYKNILDIGCGMGVDIISLAQKIQYNSINGIELTFDMALSAKQNTKDLHDINIVCADMEKIPFRNDHFDLIISNAAIHLVRDKNKVFSECNRIIKKTGKMVVSDLMIKGELPDILTREYEESEGLFLFGGLRSEEKYIESALNCGFRSVEIVERKEFRPAKTILSLLQNAGKVENTEKLYREIENVRFYSNIILLKTYIDSEMTDVHCKCGNVKKIIYVNPINITISPVLADEYINRNINYAYCEKCGKEIFTPDPILIHDMKKRIMIHVFPKELETSHEMIQNMVSLKVGTGNLEGYTHKIFFGFDASISFIKEL